MTPFAQFAAIGPSAMPLLPLAHTVDWYRFCALRADPVLSPEPCDVYPDQLLYFFYGKPCYQPHGDVAATSLASFHSVSLILDATSLPDPLRILPFDSGAFELGLYGGNLHPKMKLPAFELSPAMKDVPLAVGKFFGDNKAYYRGVPRPEMGHDCGDLEVEAFLSIITTRGATACDDRRSAIEIQIADIVDLLSAKVLAVIIPEQFLDHQPTWSFIVDTLGAEPLGYYCPHGRPEQDARAILGEAFRYYREQGWL